jgi:hypothetical protein
MDLETEKRINQVALLMSLALTAFVFWFCGSLGIEIPPLGGF